MKCTPRYGFGERVLVRWVMDGLRWTWVGVVGTVLRACDILTGAYRGGGTLSCCVAGPTLSCKLGLRKIRHPAHAGPTSVVYVVWPAAACASTAPGRVRPGTGGWCWHVQRYGNTTTHNTPPHHRVAVCVLRRVVTTRVVRVGCTAAAPGPPHLHTTVVPPGLARDLPVHAHLSRHRLVPLPRCHPHQSVLSSSTADGWDAFHYQDTTPGRQVVPRRWRSFCQTMLREQHGSHHVRVLL